MEEQDKIYLWLVVIAFIALLMAMGFGWAEILDLKDQNIINGGASSSATPR